MNDPVILVVDDDAHIRELISHFLIKAGFQVLEASDGTQGLRVSEDYQVDLALVDIMMSGLDGWALCRALKQRAKKRELPVILLTAKGETIHKVRGFELGADDYMVKPFDPPELIARVKSLLRRYRKLSAHEITVGPLTLRPDSFEATLADQQLTLPKKEFELLVKLAGEVGRTFTRDSLLTDVWGMDFDGTERTVDVHVSRLRERLDSGTPRIQIEGVRGLGYRLTLAEA